MQALFHAPKMAMANISMAAVQTEVNSKESLRLTRYISKIALLLTELELCAQSDAGIGGRGEGFWGIADQVDPIFLHGRLYQSRLIKHVLDKQRYCSHTDSALIQLASSVNDSPADDQQLMAVVDSLTSPLKQAEAVLQHCASAEPGSSWPLEDWASFQAVVLALGQSMKSMHAWALAALSLPHDVIDDISHFSEQLSQLHFTEEQFKVAASKELAEAQRQSGAGEVPCAPDAEPTGGLGDKCAGKLGMMQPLYCPAGLNPNLWLCPQGRKAPAMWRRPPRHWSRASGPPLSCRRCLRARTAFLTHRQERPDTGFLSTGVLTPQRPCRDSKVGSEGACLQSCSVDGKPTASPVTETRPPHPFQLADQGTTPSDLPKDPFNMTPRLASGTLHELKGLQECNAAKHEGA